MTNILKCRQIHINSQKKANETHSGYYHRIKSEFINNVFQNKYTFRGKTIKFQKYKNAFGEIESFYHVTTEDNGNGMRVLSLKRYESCLLIFLILDECICNKVTCQCVTIKSDYNNDERISIFCGEYEYAIILEEKPTYYKFVTAFPVNGPNTKNYL